MLAVFAWRKSMKLPSEVAGLWDDYLLAEDRHLRSEALARLGAFIERVEGLQPDLCNSCIQELIEWILEQKDEIPVRTPLFERLLFPTLLERYRAGDSATTFWLAEHFRMLSSAKRCWAEIGRPSEVALLMAAYRRNPRNEQLRLQLVSRIARDLWYSLHELPDGVLFPANGGSDLDQCDRLIEELVFLKGLLHGQEAVVHRDLIEEAEYHYHAYREFLLTPGKYQSYEEFLRARGIEC
jgi:hypothetical protein